MWILVGIGFAAALVEFFCLCKPNENDGFGGCIAFLIVRTILYSFFSVMFIQITLLAIIVVPIYIAYRIYRALKDV